MSFVKETVDKLLKGYDIRLRPDFGGKWGARGRCGLRAPRRRRPGRRRERAASGLRRRVGGGLAQSPEPCRSPLTPARCASRRSPSLRGDEHRHRQYRHGLRSQHGECCPSEGAPEPPPLSPGPRACTARGRRPPELGRASRAAGRAAGRRDRASRVPPPPPDSGAQGARSPPRVPDRSEPLPPPPERSRHLYGLSPGPQAPREPSRLPSNRRWEPRERREVGGWLSILGKRSLRFPLLSFGKRCWQLEGREGGGGLCILEASRVSFRGVHRLRKKSRFRHPAPRFLCRALSEVLTGSFSSEQEARSAGDLSYRRVRGQC